MVAKSLKNAVLAQMNGTKSEKMEALKDVARHGAAGGFGGFIYYTDTVPFARRNRSLIVERLNRDVEDTGSDSVVGMLRAWPTFKHYSTPEIDAMWAAYLMGKKNDDATLENALAWYALEAVAGDVEYDRDAA